MDKPKVQHAILWKVNNSENATEPTKMCHVNWQDFITDCQVRDWFLKIRSDDTLLRDKPRRWHSSEVDLDTLKELAKCNPRKKRSIIISRRQRIAMPNLPLLKDDRKDEQVGRLVS